MAIKYEINDNNEVMAWDDSIQQAEPFLYQPHYPDGTPFTTKDEAMEWAVRWYSHFTDPDNNPEFPTSPL